MDAGTKRGVGADAAMTVSVLFLGSFLVAAGSAMADRWFRSAPGGQTANIDDLLAAIAIAVGLAIVAWWILSMLLATAAAVLARNGRTRAAAATGSLCPAFMRRLALAALSVQLLSAPLANAAAPPPAGPEWAPTQEVAVSAAWSPTDGTGEARPASELQPNWLPSALPTEPDLLAARPARDAQPAFPTTGDITVLAGDSLWDIAARELGPAATDLEVALRWPRWYHANEAVIGQNPDVLLPGQILRSPSAA